ncbi:2-C-methyl-D-erythritol 2,4-cyclodiphosphate synthase, partial [Candidatus Pelagibacter sp.]|nr:2-C-methyl-D-erythritol 2,4-cyclodiphosphate synthase [Candidatus Pelagibacter sp.]
SVNKALKSNLFKSIIIVSNIPIKNLKDKSIKVIKGGRERYQSSQKALNYIKNKNFTNVFIHDAARPNFSIRLLKKLNLNLKKNNAVVPYLTTDNSTKYRIKNKIQNLNRENLLFTQTPQCFNFKSLFNLSKLNNTKITDEATLFLDNKKKIKFIKGEENNFKITTKSDLNKINIRNFYGIGFDIHKLIKNKKLYLGGVKIPFHSGLQGHSDGDVIIHAIIDGLLGAMRKKDIGTIYPSNKRRFQNIRSPNMLYPILKNLDKQGYFINNIDINLICERPKVSKFRNKIIVSLSNLLNINKDQINLKGKTVEKLGLIGKEEAIACEVIVSLNYYA